MKALEETGAPLSITCYGHDDLSSGDVQHVFANCNASTVRPSGWKRTELTCMRTSAARRCATICNAVETGHGQHTYSAREVPPLPFRPSFLHSAKHGLRQDTNMAVTGKRTRAGEAQFSACRCKGGNRKACGLRVWTPERTEQMDVPWQLLLRRGHVL